MQKYRNFGKTTKSNRAYAPETIHSSTDICPWVNMETGIRSVPGFSYWIIL